MKEKSTKILYTIVAIAILVIVGTWWANGFEREDAWLYIVSIAVVITCLPVSGSQKTKDSHDSKKDH